MQMFAASATLDAAGSSNTVGNQVTLISIVMGNMLKRQETC